MTNHASVDESVLEAHAHANIGLWPRSRAIFAESLEAIADALDWLSLGVFLVDSTGQVLFMNQSAADMVGEDAGIDLQGRRLVAFDPDQTHDLQDLICRAVSDPESPRDGGCMASRFLDPAPGCPCRLSPCRCAVVRQKFSAAPCQRLVTRRRQCCS